MLKLRKKEKEMLLKIFILISAVLCAGMVLSDFFELSPTIERAFEDALSDTAIGQLADSGLIEQFKRAMPEMQKGFEEEMAMAEEENTTESKEGN